MVALSKNLGRIKTKLPAQFPDEVGPDIPAAMNGHGGLMTTMAGDDVASFAAASMISTPAAFSRRISCRPFIGT
jgi:hypothetical protein